MRALRGLTSVVGGLLACLAFTGAAQALPSTMLASTDGTGSALGSGATDVTMTPDGRYVAFVTAVPLVAGDTNGTRDVYRRDRRTHEIVRISMPDPALQTFDGSSSHPSMSADGNIIAFESLSENLVANDINGGSDVYVRNVAAGTTVRASVRTDGTVAGPATINNDDVMQPAISADGRTVAWVGPDFAFNNDGSGLTFHVFARQLDQPAAERVDGLPNGAASNGEISNDGPSISGDGRFIAFSSAASDLVPNDTNGKLDVFVRDRTLHTTQRASVSSNGGEVTGADSVRPVISGDGSVVAFDSVGTNIVTGDLNGANDVFVRDLRFGQTSRASVGPNGAESQYGGTSPAISATGRYVAFQTISQLISSDTSSNYDIYVVDRDTGAIQRASVLSDGGNALGSAGVPLVVGPTGRFVLFETLSIYANGDNNSANDGYLRDNGINAAPVATPQTTITPGSLEITVDGTASSDVDGWVDSYSWSFGDGSSANGPQGPHRYAAPGRYSVVLTVTDNDGATTTATTTVDVTGPAAPGGPGAGPEPLPQVGHDTAAAPKAPRNLKRPTISRDKKHANVLRCSPGRWEGKPKFAYRWLRDGKAIKRAAKSTHKVVRADAGHKLACRVTATLPGRPAGTATSASRRIAKTTNKRAHR
ncbi:PKD domain-containing protein [Baekduia sp.]|jgi:Tol biopolymer transport system component|uniref:PKD domain-containing protein n=1 Tax=Baekduia sp. TaxID=2600305 RepID=UPI002DF7CFEC|nr:PKD domain-containing protein [Baekduia sp.]